MLPILLGTAALFSIGSSIYSGKKLSTEAKFNAALKQQQANLIDQQMQLSIHQWDREIGRAKSTLTNRVAGSGIMMSGSPMAALVDMSTQMEMDKEIETYNLEMQKKGVLSEAAAYRRQAKTAKTVGYLNAFSGLLSAGADYYKSR
jgi:hypothetical protein